MGYYKKKAQHNAKCKQCGIGFRTVRNHQIFCSTRCNYTYWNAQTRGNKLRVHDAKSGPMPELARDIQLQPQLDTTQRPKPQRKPRQFKPKRIEKSIPKAVPAPVVLHPVELPVLGLLERIKYVFRPDLLAGRLFKLFPANVELQKLLDEVKNAPPPPPAPVEPEPVLPKRDQDILKLHLFGAYDKIKKVEHELENAATVADFRGERVGILEDKVSALSLDNKEYLRRLKAGDEVIKSLSAQLKDSVTKSVYSTVIAKIRDEYKESLEKARVQLLFGNHEATLHSPTASSLGEGGSDGRKRLPDPVGPVD